MGFRIAYVSFCRLFGLQCLFDGNKSDWVSDELMISVGAKTVRLHGWDQTEAVKPVLGQYYREPVKSGPFPLHLWKVLLKSLSEDHYVSDEGEILFYQRDAKGSAAL